MDVLSKCITTFVSNRARVVRNIFCGFNKSAEQIRFQSELKLIKEKFKETIKLEHHWRQSRMTNGLKLLEMKHLQNEYSSINGRCIDIYSSLDSLISRDIIKSADDGDDVIVENGIDVEIVPAISPENTFDKKHLKWIDQLKSQASDLSDRIVAQMEPIVYGLNPPRDHVKPKSTPKGTFVGGKRKNRNDTFRPAEKHLTLGGPIDTEAPGCSKWTSSSSRTVSGSSCRSSYNSSTTSSRSSVFSTSSQ